MPAAITAETFERLQRAFCQQAGWTVSGSQLLTDAQTPAVLCGHRLGRSPDCPKVIVSAGIHGDEPAGTLALLEFLEKGGFNDAFEWLIFPALNPSGLLAGTRENAELRDVNRDFKSCQSAESCFYIRQLQAHDRFDLHLCLHEDWEYEKAYLYELNSGGSASISSEVLQVIERCLGLLDAPLIDGHRPTAPGFIHHRLVADDPAGWPEAIYLTSRYKLLSYTLETPSQVSLSARVDCMCQFLQAALSAFVR
jgi:murein peptide amidase A